MHDARAGSESRRGPSRTSKLAAGAEVLRERCRGSLGMVGKVSIQLHEQLAFQLQAQRLDGDALEHFAGVGMNQHVAGVPPVRPRARR